MLPVTPFENVMTPSHRPKQRAQLLTACKDRGKTVASAGNAAKTSQIKPHSL